MAFKERIESGMFTFFDGAMGTMLQKEGLKAGEASETWNTAHPDTVRKIHKLYLKAGCNVVTANTFGCNPLKYDAVKMDELIRAAFENARSAIDEQKDPSDKYMALDIGPLGRLLKPLGDITFEKAVEYFSSIVKTGIKYGADLILIETMTDLYETKAALLAAKESCSLPVIVSNAYEENGRLMTGAIPEAVIATLEGLHADAIGVNCSFGPEKLKPVIEKYLELSTVPVIVQPNAGMPEERDGKAYYSMKESEYAGFMQEFAGKGATLLGGCCGTEPGHIDEMIKVCRSICPGKRNTVKKPVISSASQVIYPVMDQPLLIGERINPTGKKRMKEALRSNDFSYILSMAIEQQEAGAHVLDVNAGIPDIDETEMLPQIVSEVQAVCSLPLQIDSGNTDALEKALRVYNGKALVNSVNGTTASMEGVFPLIRKYGGMLIALTLDENGIPNTVQGRVDIALKITAEAEKYGISKNDLVFDPLTMAVSAGQNAAKVTLDTVRKLHEMGFYTGLGISNVSFGLPGRENINAAFFISAVQKGLTFGIVNPCSDRMMEAYRMACLFEGYDDNCIGYIQFADTHDELFKTSGQTTAASSAGGSSGNTVYENTLENAVYRGLKAEAARLTLQLIAENADNMEIINGQIIPALNRVGEAYEDKKLYLPQLLMSAEAAGSAFEVIKNSRNERNETASDAERMKIVLATVKGDIHDIGKNIVRLLLENYNFDVIDLGKDMPAETILESIKEFHAPLCGLSALMTTTVSSMAETIKLIKKHAPYCRIAVGGAVLTEEYACQIGADFYGKDAMATVRYAQQVKQGS